MERWKLTPFQRVELYDHGVYIACLGKREQIGVSVEDNRQDSRPVYDFPTPSVRHLWRTALGCIAAVVVRRADVSFGSIAVAETGGTDGQVSANYQTLVLRRARQQRFRPVVMKIYRYPEPTPTSG
jgi:hypothetical protein